MDQYLIQKKTLVDIANAIRAKIGSTELIDPTEMPAKIDSITVGGGGSGGSGGGEDVTEETAEYTEKLSTLETAITELEEELERKASGGGSSIGEFTKYAKVIATPASSTSFTITNPSGGIAKKVFVKRLATDTPSDRKIQQYIADLDFRMGVLYAVSSDGGARYTVTAVNSGVNNGNFMITEGKITLYRFNSSNTWDANSEYEVEIYE